MLEILLLISVFTGGVTMGLGGAAPTPQAAVAQAPTPAPDQTSTAAAPVPEGTAQADTAPAPAASGFVPEDQTPTGKFTTATEVKPILGATRANWIAIREWQGRDLIYFTHLESWRCGLAAVYYGVNGAPAQTAYPLEPCHLGTATPNALTMQDHLPYVKFPLQAVQQVDIRVLYDDGSQESARFLRRDVLMP